MGFDYVHQIPKAKEMGRETAGFSAELKKIKREKDKEILAVFTGAVDKLILIRWSLLGP